MAGDSTGPTVALLPGGDLFEDFHDKIGISLEAFREEFTGGWLFNYVEALAVAGMRTLLIYASARVSSTLRFTHRPTGADVCILPCSRAYSAARALSGRLSPRPASMTSAISYLATPLIPLARELRRRKCAAVLTQEYEDPRFDVCVLMGKVLDLPVFGIFQGADRPRSWLERLVRRRAIAGSAGLIIGAGAEIARVRDSYRVPTDKIGHIPNPVDVALWRSPQDPERRGAVRPGRVVVGWHGRVQIHRKGLDILLRAWDRIAEREERPLLLLVGSGRDGGDLRRLLRERADDDIRWIDRYVLDPAELVRYVSGVDVSVLPSRHEGFPVAVIEAMACGVAVVAADVHGVRDIIGDDGRFGGVIVPSGDSDRLAHAVGQLLDDPSRRATLGRRARQRAESAFSLESVGRALRRFLAARGASLDGRG
jgi:glycosyltransferase involved in cell wall biosynthesis